MVENLHLGGIFNVFGPYLFIQTVKYLKFHMHNLINILSNTSCKQHVQEISGSDCIVGIRLLFLRLGHFFGIFGVFHILSVVMQLSERLEIWTGCTVSIVI